MQSFHRKKFYNLVDNKEMIINDIYGIDIDKFRLFTNQSFNLGKYITIVSGRNGTMKSTLMGLVAHPYRTTEEDINNKKMHTSFRDVFKLSAVKDRTDYLYHIRLNIDDDIFLREPIPLYFQAGNEETQFSKKNRHRIVPSGREKGDGYFSLPSVYINLKRLYPLVASGEISSKEIDYSPLEKEFIRKFYQKILLRSEFKDFGKYSTKTSSLGKNPYGPENSYYDVNSISSGEDNLSTFVDILISFMRIFKSNKEKKIHRLTGLLSIDEFEASLHPIAQMNLFNFLLQWCQEYNVKIVLNTHSLYLIQQLYLKYSIKLEKKDLLVNFIGSQFQKDNTLVIYENPEYKLAYSELTLSSYEEKNKLLKVKILCEDSVAALVIKRVLKKQSITSQIEFSHVVNEDNPGTSSSLLASLCKSFPVILKETKAIVIFDADIDLSKQKIGSFPYAYSIPSLFNLPVEKEIVKYINSLDGNNAFFKRFDTSKEMFLQQFSEFNIDYGNTDYSKLNIQPFKNWYNKNKKDINTYITYYINQNKDTQSFLNFRDTVLNSINKIRVKNGFLPIED